MIVRNAFVKTIKCQPAIINTVGIHCGVIHLYLLFIGNKCKKSEHDIKEMNMFTAI
jgi:hypothetical protein